MLGLKECAATPSLKTWLLTVAHSPESLQKPAGTFGGLLRWRQLASSVPMAPPAARKGTAASPRTGFQVGKAGGRGGRNGPYPPQRANRGPRPRAARGRRVPRRRGPVVQEPAREAATPNELARDVTGCPEDSLESAEILPWGCEVNKLSEVTGCRVDLALSRLSEVTSCQLDFTRTHEGGKKDARKNANCQGTDLRSQSLRGREVCEFQALLETRQRDKK